MSLLTYGLITYSVVRCSLATADVVERMPDFPIVSGNAIVSEWVMLNAESQADALPEVDESPVHTTTVTTRAPAYTGAAYASTLDSRLERIFGYDDTFTLSEPDWSFPSSEAEMAADLMRREEYASTLRMLADIETHLKAFDAEAPASMRPFVGGPDERRDACPDGELMLHAHITMTGAANLFHATLNGRRVIVKYAHDCQVRVKQNVLEHPLYTDALFLNVLASSGVVVRPIHLSAPAAMGSSPPIPVRILTEVTYQRFGVCIAAKTQVRFLVMEEAGMSLNHYLHWLAANAPWSTYAKRAVSLTIRIIEMLEIIHDKGVIHGDIHVANILFRTPTDSPSQVGVNDTDLVFIDFEYSEFYPDQINSSEDKPRRPINPALLSPWQLRGKRMGRRDDVYRGVELLANALSLNENQKEISRQIHELPKTTPRRDVDALLAAMRSPALLFRFALAKMGPDRDVLRAEEVLDELQRSQLGSLIHPDQRPDYSGLVSNLKELRELI